MVRQQDGHIAKGGGVQWPMQQAAPQRKGLGVVVWVRSENLGSPCIIQVMDDQASIETYDLGPPHL